MEPSAAVRRTWIDYGAAIAFVLAVLVYANTFAHGATLDDVFIVQRNPLAHGIGEIGRIFTTSWWGFDPRLPDASLYRPFTVATFALESTLFGEALWPRHVVNVLLHAIASALVFAALRRWFGSASLALVAAVLFAVHPVHVEAVAGLVGRAEILAALGILGALYAWSRGWFASSVLFCAMGAFSKEIGITAPFVLLAAEWFAPGERRLLRGNRRALVAGAAMIAVIAVYLALRAQFTAPNRVEMGMVGMPAGERLPNACAALVEYARLFAFPLRLSADYTWTEVPPVTSLSDARFLFGATLAIGALAAAWFARLRAPAIAWGLVVAAATFAPVSNFLFGSGVIVAERALYSPSIGLCAIAGAGCAFALARPARARATWIAITLVMAGCCLRTWTRNPVWKDNGTLGHSIVETAPGSHIAHDILAQWFVARGDFGAAKPHVKAALARLDYADMRYLEGEIASGEERNEDAVRAFRRAIELDPTHAGSYNQLALLLSDLDRPEEAYAVLLAMQRACPNEPSAWLNLVMLHSQYSNSDLALAVALDAVARFPRSSKVLRTAAAAQRAVGHEAEAAELERRAAELSDSP